MNASTLALLASSLLERRSVHGPIHSRDISDAFGVDALSEALRRRWLIPAYSAVSGSGLELNRSEPFLINMREAMNEPGAGNNVGDHVQIVGSDGNTYDGVVSSVAGDKVKLVFPRGRPPGYRDDLDYEAKNLKVTKKSTPDARNTDTRPAVGPGSAGTPSTPAPNVFGGLSR